MLKGQGRELTAEELYQARIRTSAMAKLQNPPAVRCLVVWSPEECAWLIEVLKGKEVRI
jgi:hypothetical protein